MMPDEVVIGLDAVEELDRAPRIEGGAEHLLSADAERLEHLSALEKAEVEVLDARRPLLQAQVPVRLQCPDLGFAKVARNAVLVPREMEDLGDRRVGVVRVSARAPSGHALGQDLVQLSHAAQP